MKSPRGKWLLSIVFFLGVASLYRVISHQRAFERRQQVTIQKKIFVRTKPQIQPPAAAAEALGAPTRKSVMIGIIPPERVKLKKRITSKIPPKKIFAEIKTTLGTVTIQLHFTLAKNTSQNFIDLVEGEKKSIHLEAERLDGRPYYDGLLIFRVVKDYFIQMGDPLNSGRGGPGYFLEPENVKTSSEIEPGDVVMAENSAGISGSQFFIVLETMSNHLGNRNSVFGKVVAGLQVVQKISEVKADVFSGMPINPIEIKKISIKRIYSEPKTGRNPNE